MKILVTGPKGFVGSRIMDAMDATGSGSLKDFTEKDIQRMVDSVCPDVIVHTAAISDIMTCEKNPMASYRANVELPVWLVRTGVKSIIYSTDQVYSGCVKEGPYSENDVSPANLYARHKLEMEQRTLEINPDTVLLRATWMYDMPRYGTSNRGNFLVNMLRMNELEFSATQHRAVTYVREVADLMKKAIYLPGGIYNYGSENELTMLETAEWLADELNLSITLKDAGPGHNLWMNCEKLKSCGISFKSTIDGLKQCIRDYSLKV